MTEPRKDDPTSTASALDQELRELPRPARHAVIVGHEAGDVRSNVRGAGAGGRHDRLVGVEDLDESSSQRLRLVHMTGVEVHLAAAGLLARELHLDSATLEDFHRRAPDRRRERVGETRNEESVRHHGGVYTGRAGRERRDELPAGRPGLR